jgi:hypothetical protein
VRTAKVPKAVKPAKTDAVKADSPKK